MPIESYLINNYYKYTYILTFNSNILKYCPNSIFYIYGSTWINQEDYLNIDSYRKEFLLTSITGDKLMTIAHEFRHKCYLNQSNIKNIPSIWYRSGHSTLLPNLNNNPIITTDIGSKFETLKHSQFTLVIENSSQENYFTEKLIDALITKNIPIYYGCPNISNFFDTTGWIMLDSLSVDDLLNKVNSINSEYYSKFKTIIDKNYITAQSYSDIYTNINNAMKTQL